MSSRIEGDVVYTGNVSYVGAINIPSQTIVDNDVSLGAAIDAAKLKHRHPLNHGQADGADVVSETKLLHIARAAATLSRVEVRPTTAPTGGDKQFTVDVQKASNGSGVWTTLLNAVVTVDATSVDDTLQSAVLAATPTLADGDALRVVITASGTTGSQGQGVVVAIDLDESPS